MGDDIDSRGAKGDDMESRGAMGDDLESRGEMGDDIESRGEMRDDIESRGAMGDDLESRGKVGDDMESKGEMVDDLESRGKVGDDMESKDAMGDDMESKGEMVDDLESRGEMGHDFPEWIYFLDPVLFRLEISPEGQYVPSLNRSKVGHTQDGGNHLTQDDEYNLMTKQVTETKGFDIDFSLFRYDFNYGPVDFDGKKFDIDGETTRDLMDRLSRKSLERYNEEKETAYELVEVSKANYHPCGAGMMFFITFLGKDSSSEPKIFQAKVHFSYFDANTYVTCDLKPEKKVHSIEFTEKEGAKKSRLTEEKDATMH